MRNGHYQWLKKRYLSGHRWGGWSPLTIACGACLFFSGAALARPPQLRSSNASLPGYAIATESRTASREAGQVLAQGGTAADAAIVAALVAGVTSPTSSGIGGGGFLVGWDAKTGTSYVIDFRETAPRGQRKKSTASTSASASAAPGSFIGVPGEVRGLFALHQRAGKLPWRDLVKRASHRATQGFTVERHLASMLAYRQKKLQGIGGFSSLFYPGGRPALVGMRLTHPALGRTLEKIAAQGPSAFYEGKVAENIVKVAQDHGSTLSLEDLRNYKVQQRQALKIDYNGYEIYTMPPPSAGGLLMAQTLKMFSADYLQNLGHGSPAYQHVLAEAFRGAIADRMRYLGDPQFEKFSLGELLDEERLEKRRKKIVLDRTHSIPRFGLKEKGTHALVSADKSGNTISLTTTINHLFGAKIYAQQSGIVLNNELADFNSFEQVKFLGLSESPNRYRPQARPVSSMTPTIVVKYQQPVLALGGSGGTAIATNVTQALLSALVFDHEPQKAVAAKRFYIPTQGAHISLEKGAQMDHIRNLERRGEIVTTMKFTTSAVQMLRMDGGKMRGASDPRKHGLSLTQTIR